MQYFNLVNDGIINEDELKLLYPLAKTFYENDPLKDERNPADAGRAMIISDKYLIVGIKDIGEYIQIHANNKELGTIFHIYNGAVFKRSNVEIVRPVDLETIDKSSLSEIIHDILDQLTGKSHKKTNGPRIYHDEKMKRECQEAIENLDDLLHKNYEIDPVQAMIDDAKHYIHMNEKKMS